MSSMSSMMSFVNEQICYIPCNFCNIVLAVSVPCSSLFEIVTVRCGHCANLWSVDMATVLQSLSLQDLQMPNYGDQNQRVDLPSSSKNNDNIQVFQVNQQRTAKTEKRVVNHPTEKKQRVPSAYNQFIREEIHRIKANNPDINHRKAFSMAAKNWAHIPHAEYGLMSGTKNNQC